MLLHCLATGQHYPEAPEVDTGAPRYAAVGDLIHAAEEDARVLIADGLAYAVCPRCYTALDAAFICPLCGGGING